jgi:hypothetical protein
MICLLRSWFIWAFTACRGRPFLFWSSGGWPWTASPAASSAFTSPLYLWMYVGVRWAIQFLHVGNVILLPLLVTAGVAFESLVVAFSAVVLASAALAGGIHIFRCFGQVLWGAVTGPF